MNLFDDDVVFGAQRPHWVVPVPAAELFDWGWLAGELADWLATTGPATAIELDQCFRGRPTHRGVVRALDRVATRIDTLLEASRS